MKALRSKNPGGGTGKKKAKNRTSEKGAKRRKNNSKDEGGGSGEKSLIQEENVKTYTKEDLLTPIRTFRDLQNATKEEKSALMIKKLRLSCVIFDFSEDSNVNAKDNIAKEVKRQTLLDLIDHITTGRKWFSEDIVVPTLEMVSINLFRSLPPSPYSDWDPEEDDPALDPQWPHLQLVYEFLLRFIVSSQADVKTLRRYIKKNNKEFLVSMIDLFRSEDPREREYLKTILHRIYGKFMAFRSFIRKQINFVFYHLIFTNSLHCGVSELLEILGSIINGFALPLKKEHKRFLRNVLIPLHKVRTFSQFSQQLAYCVTQFIDKDPSLASTVIGGLLSYWPNQSAMKEQLFLNELEEVLEASTQKEVTKMVEPLFRQIAKCVASPHFQVAERALFLWNNDAVAQFTNEHRIKILPILFPALNSNTQHWNATVNSLAFNIIRMFMEMDITLWDKVSKAADTEAVKNLEKEKKRTSRWMTLKSRAKELEKKRPVAKVQDEAKE